MFEHCEDRQLLAGDVFQERLPTKTGAAFDVNTWDYDVTQQQLGSNDFSGNTGTTESVHGVTTTTLTSASNGSTGGSLSISFDFSDQPDVVFAGYFESLAGLTDTPISLDGTGQQPESTTPLPGYSLDTQDIYKGFGSFTDRSVEFIELDVQAQTADPVTLRLELTDEHGHKVYTHRFITPAAVEWETISLALPTGFDKGDTAPFDWRQVSVFAIIVERNNSAEDVHNPDTGNFLIDNLRLVDEDGEYPDLAAAATPDGGLAPQYTDAFLDLIRETSSLYFVDWSSTDSRTGGLIQDRSTFGDLITTGGAGFQLTSYVIDAEQGYLDRSEAASRSLNILRALANTPQGPERVGTIGYEGFFYHFVGIDGSRKQNFDFVDTEEDESLSTVELSVIDTALAVAGALTNAAFFDSNTPAETEIRQLADSIYARVNWQFLLYVNPSDPGDPQNNQFLLGWKPNEVRDDDSGHHGRFKLNDSAGLGQYSSKDVGGIERPATIDYYTDEGLLVALLAMASPNSNHRVGRDVWDAMLRDDEGGDFVKSYPGSLFTYQFSGIWLDTEELGQDNHSTRPLNIFVAVHGFQPFSTRNWCW